jgi:hypothetical protein
VLCRSCFQKQAKPAQRPEPAAAKD